MFLSNLFMIIFYLLWSRGNLGSRFTTWGYYRFECNLNISRILTGTLKYAYVIMIIKFSNFYLSSDLTITTLINYLHKGHAEYRHRHSTINEEQRKVLWELITIGGPLQRFSSIEILPYPLYPLFPSRDRRMMLQLLTGFRVQMSAKVTRGEFADRLEKLW